MIDKLNKSFVDEKVVPHANINFRTLGSINKLDIMTILVKLLEPLALELLTSQQPTVHDACILPIERTVSLSLHDLINSFQMIHLQFLMSALILKQ